MTELPATGEWPAPTGAVPADAPAVPGYEILAELGRGGMGVVYKARQVSLRRLVALKLIRDGALAGPQQRARFRIEAEVAARMRHPNIVHIYEVGEHQGRPYFAMELVEGGSLHQHLAGRRLPAPQAAALVRALALAVQHAHAQQIIHRDLKPANILMESRIEDPPGEISASLNPKIADFGLAKRLDSDSTAWTHDGAVLGTAGYMAPEQAAGRVREVGPACDVYALGAILYECLTGRPPVVADTWEEALRQVLHYEPTPPARLNADVPRDLETVCLKCLEKEPERRYASAEELADELGRFLEAKPVAAVPLGARERLARLAGRDGYEIVSEIGRGPRSTVYRAHYGPLRQPVALKVFPEGACTRDEWEARVRRGAELWTFLAHPHVVPVQRAGWWDGAPYVVTEYVAGGSLADKLTGRLYPVVEALRLVAQLAEVVSYLHRQGVAHGNLKPGNVLLAAGGIPRLVDFRTTGGLSVCPSLADDSAPDGLAYWPPELARDPTAEPRPYTDFYGLGVILYELLTGRPPFRGATARETLEQVRSHDPAPFARRSTEVTPALEAFCLECLRKNPWRRFERAYDVLSRLRSFHDALTRRTEPDKQQSRRPRGRGGATRDR
jgi:serine/threonine protein kinase